MTVVQYKVHELTGALLDAVVAHVGGGLTPRMRSELVVGTAGADGRPVFKTVCWLYDEVSGYGVARFRPSSDWADGGPIIEREKISLHPPTDTAEWEAVGPATPTTERVSGPTPLVAAMRAFLAARVGDTVELPA